MSNARAFSQHERHSLIVGLLACVVSAACAGATSTHRAISTPTASITSPPTVTAVPSPTLLPAVYAPVRLAQGAGCPDDLTLDSQGRVLFTDWWNGSLNRIAADGQVTTLVTGLPKAEGIALAKDGTIILAEQGTNGQHIDQLVHQLPGTTDFRVFATFTNTTDKPGIDNISLFPQTGDLLVADSPNGRIYRVSQDGSQRQLLASGFVRPTAALADISGHIFVADEYGNSVIRLDPDGSRHLLVQVPAPDDLAFDLDGTLLVTVLGNNTVIRLDPAAGGVLQTVATDLFEPQGLAVDAQGNLYVAEETANLVVKLQRGGTTVPFAPPHLSGMACG